MSTLRPPGKIRRLYESPHTCDFMSSNPNYRVTKPVQRTPTCDVCKLRHQKCSGDQPQCSNCKLRGINCLYSGPRTRAPEIKKPPDGSDSSASQYVSIKSSSLSDPAKASNRQNRPSISDADYDRLYSEIFGEIVSYIPILLST
jgi:Fungal Zn(2)-Cys(6) binuclear cluster domain